MDKLINIISKQLSQVNIKNLISMSNSSIDNMIAPIIKYLAETNNLSLNDGLVYECNKITIFCINLLKGQYYPIHSHPKMVVLSKVIKGHIESETLDFKNEDYYNLSNIKKAGIKDNIIECKNYKTIDLKENAISVVYPKTNNLHSLYALQDSIVLDIILNKYEDDGFTIFKLLDEKRLKIVN